MSILFTGREMLETAIEIERNGFSFYSELARAGKVFYEDRPLPVGALEVRGTAEATGDSFRVGAIDLQSDSLGRLTGELAFHGRDVSGRLDGADLPADNLATLARGLRGGEGARGGNASGPRRVSGPRTGRWLRGLRQLAHRGQGALRRRIMAPPGAPKV